ncbi:MAG: CarD family transcriptional regulator [Nisaea sp.]|uniref:CarD family transcriptional regulator n=1 Tax=Nisaea sp. TaxID=2024842 RepID=UPI003298E619
MLVYDALYSDLFPAIGIAVVFIILLLLLVVMTWRERSLLASLSHPAFGHTFEDMKRETTRVRVPETPINVEMLREVARLTASAAGSAMGAAAAAELVRGLIHMIPPDQRSSLRDELEKEEEIEVQPTKVAGSSRTAIDRETSFHVGDTVVYPAHGVGKIASIEKQEVGGSELELFVIEFEKDKMALRVPTNRALEVGMRALATPDIVSRVMKTLRGKARIKKAMWSRRAQEFEQKINSGDLIAIAEVVRDLHRQDDQREQSYSERQLYEAALERLTREIAAVERVEVNKASETLYAALKSDAA